jgi:DNA adenine methylase
MGISFSPLRYPGGKQILFPTLCKLLELNGFSGKCYAEPYAGGAGAALGLLFGEHVDRLLLNDADPAIFSFWTSVLTKTDEFLKLVRDSPLTVEEWHRQKAIYSRPTKVGTLKLGFSAFYLNRCNRSGIIANAGVIGGLEQKGTWKIDARFNRTELMRRISRVARYSDRIAVFNLDALNFLEQHTNQPDQHKGCFVYLDPPYYVKGSQLYLSYYSDADHRALSSYLQKRAKFAWVLTYDDAEQIRSLYARLNVIPFNLRYSASTSRTGSEVFISRKEFTGVRTILDAIAS